VLQERMPRRRMIRLSLGALFGAFLAACGKNQASPPTATPGSLTATPRSLAASATAELEAATATATRSVSPLPTASPTAPPEPTASPEPTFPPTPPPEPTAVPTAPPEPTATAAPAQLPTLQGQVINVTFASGPLTLEGVLSVPNAPNVVSIVVFCHPLPSAGGNMNSGILKIASQAALDRGIASLRFNFRGVGQSQGATEGGVGEQDDVRAALAYAVSLAGAWGRVGLAGYSFGSSMAAAVVTPLTPALALIALPANPTRVQPAALLSYPNPVLLITGSKDTISQPPSLEALPKAMAGSVDLRIIEGASHFTWTGHERELADAVGGFFRQHLP